MSCASITDLANSIWDDLGQPTDQPVSYIQSKLVSDAFLGKLNLLTTNCHEVVTGSIVPPLDVNEEAIYAMAYQVDFYTAKANSIANGTDVGWVSLADGDSRIVRASPVDYLRVYRDMQKQLNLELNNMAYNYRMARGMARSVDMLNIDNSWNGTAAYDGGGIVPGN